MLEKLMPGVIIPEMLLLGVFVLGWLKLRMLVSKKF